MRGTASRVKSAPLGRAGERRELADLAAFLLADGAAYINGEVVTIDGGGWSKGPASSAFCSTC